MFMFYDGMNIIEGLRMITSFLDCLLFAKSMLGEESSQPESFVLITKFPTKPNP